MTLVSSQNPPKNTKYTRHCHKVKRIKLAAKIWKAPGLAGLSFFRRLWGVYTDGKVDRTKASGCPKGSSDDLTFYVTHFSKKKSGTKNDDSLSVRIWKAPGLTGLSPYRRLCGVYTDGKVDRTKASGCPKGSSDDLAFYVTHFSKKVRYKE